MSRRVSLTLEDEILDPLEEAVERFGVPRAFGGALRRQRERIWVVRWALQIGLRHIHQTGLRAQIDEYNRAKDQPQPDLPKARILPFRAS